MHIGMPLILLTVAGLALAACGSDAASGAEILLTAAGANPNTITVPNGGQVHFVNQDSADHQIASANCSALASPTLSTGQDFRATLTGPNSCHFSDALNPSATNFQGTITVSEPGAGGGGGAGY